ncbi:MAG: radical SAM-associated putative lipoprotein [Tannerella sp.]|jgi:putative lipoprotein (rSAM/lipoprotein system)|nr:radical SAM-associated putative lipoprotein [Tannerella sp.]
MKKFNRKLIRGTNWALAGLISLLGFSSSCSSDNPLTGGGTVEYGTPHADFVVSGKVTDTKGQGLSGIRVVVPKVDHHQRATSSFIPDRPVITNEIRDTLYTQGNGDFIYHYDGFPTNDSINVHMKFEDPAENARFKTDSVKVAFFSSDLKGGDGKWFDGKAEKKIDVKLRNAESE